LLGVKKEIVCVVNQADEKKKMNSLSLM